VTLVFLMMIGFGYSYFWTAASQIYLLMRKRVDETEMDEVYVEEEMPELPPMGNIGPGSTPTPTPTPTGPMSTPVDAPTLRQPEVTFGTPSAPPATAPSTAPPGDTPPAGMGGESKPTP
jgi:hypothetical protein